MSLPLKREDREYSYAEYFTWPDEGRWESIGGVLHDMTPSPSTAHQRILGALFTEFSLYLNGKTWEVFMAPFDVRLPACGEKDDATTTWVQPDIVIVGDPLKIDERGCNGAPDLVVEILSPHTACKDMREKLSLYEQAGVREYWVVHPVEQTIMIFTLSEGRYSRPDVYGKGDELKAALLDNLVIDLNRVFR